MNNLLKQIINFLGFSGIGWILDFTMYTLLAYIGINLFICNVVGAVVGLTFVYIFSTRYIFKNTGRIPLWGKYIIYIAYQIIQVYLVSKLLVIVNNILVTHISLTFIQTFSPVISKCLVTPITMVLNFIILKNMIEKI